MCVTVATMVVIPVLQHAIGGGRWRWSYLMPLCPPRLLLLHIHKYSRSRVHTIIGEY